MTSSSALIRYRTLALAFLAFAWEATALGQVAAEQSAQKAITRGLEFLQTDAAQWREERKCSTCHHGTMTVWVLSEAKSRGYAVAADRLADLSRWTKERLENVDKPRDTRPGWNMVSTPAVYLALMSQTVPDQSVVSYEELKKITGHLLRHQEKDRQWAWSLAPPKNSPPPVFESDEVVTLMASIALSPHVPADPKLKSPERDARDRAAVWLSRQKAGATTQSTALRLYRDLKERKPREEIDRGIKAILALQNQDGGWGQEKGLNSDTYASGQALYFLSLAGVSKEAGEIRRGVDFLVASQ